MREENQEPRTKNQPSTNQQTKNQQTYNFRKLDVWQRAQALTLHIIATLKPLPNDVVVSTISRQLIASSGSIAANIAEGLGRFSPAAYKNHLQIAKGSACETDSWLHLLREAGYLSAEVEGQLHRECLDLVAILTSKIHDLGSAGAPATGLACQGGIPELRHRRPRWAVGFAGL
ncbi:MAG: four helix bundle protein [Chloroflexi bacterium]|nr:four helix bundle protein [Chloroflexota bacterium]